MYNIFYSPNLGNHSPYKLIFGRKPKLLINIETNPDIKISGTFKDYHTLLTKRLNYMQKPLQNFKMKQLALLNKDREYFQYNSGYLVYIISPLTSQMRTSSRKVWCQLCRTLGSIQNCRSTQLPTHDNRGTTDGRIVWAWKTKASHITYGQRQCQNSTRTKESHEFGNNSLSCLP